MYLWCEIIIFNNSNMIVNFILNIYFLWYLILNYFWIFINVYLNREVCNWDLIFMVVGVIVKLYEYFFFLGFYYMIYFIVIKVLFLK